MKLLLQGRGYLLFCSAGFQSLPLPQTQASDLIGAVFPATLVLWGCPEKIQARSGHMALNVSASGLVGPESDAVPITVTSHQPRFSRRLFISVSTGFQKAIDSGVPNFGCPMGSTLPVFGSSRLTLISVLPSFGRDLE